MACASGSILARAARLASVRRPAITGSTTWMYALIFGSVPLGLITTLEAGSQYRSTSADGRSAVPPVRSELSVTGTNEST